MKVVRHLSAGEVYMGRFNHGVDIITELEAFCLEKAIRVAWVSIIGALSKASISYYDQVRHEYFTKTLAGEYEIVSCTGNISLCNEKPMAHLHIVLSDADCNTLGGHLMAGGTSLFAGEFVIHAFEKFHDEHPDLIRLRDEQTGLTLWH